MAGRYVGSSVAVIAMALLPVGGLASAETSTTVPSKLIGQWSRRVSLADLKRANTGVIPPVVPVGTACVLTIKTTSAIHLTCTRIGKIPDGKLIPVGTNRYYLKIDVPERNVYQWKVVGPSLTLTKVTDPVSDRVAVFWGVWKRT